MKRRMTFAEFLKLLPKTGWKFRVDKAIVRADDDTQCNCPWIYVRDQPGVINASARSDVWWLWNAADNSPGHDPAIRAALIKACGLEAK